MGGDDHSVCKSTLKEGNKLREEPAPVEKNLYTQRRVGTRRGEWVHAENNRYTQRRI